MVTLRCFGGVAAVGEDGVEHQLRSRKHLGLLLYLVAHPRTVHSREELAGLLWDGNGRKERHSLSQALYDIRSNVAPLVAVDSNTVRLRPERIRYEAAEFERAVREKDHETALDLYRGEFAPNLLNLGVESFDRWLDAERESHRVLAALALRNAQRAAEERGDWDEMCLAALRLIRDNEFDDEAHCALMRGLWLKGDPASALAHYESVKARLPSHSYPTVADLAFRMENERSPWTRSSRPILIGRQWVCRRLTSLLHASFQSPQRVLLYGEPGVGKTLLAQVIGLYAKAHGSEVLLYDQHMREGLSLHPISRATDSHKTAIYDINQNSRSDGAIALDGSDFVLLTSRTATTLTDLPEPHHNWSFIPIGRLDLHQTQDLLRAAFPEASASTQKAAARLSGGNPHLALQLIGAAQLLNPHADFSVDDEEMWGCRVLSASQELHRFLQAAMLDVPLKQQALLKLLAILTPEGRSAGYRILTSDEWRDAASALQRRGLISTDGMTASFCHPLLALLLRLEQPERLIADGHRMAARVLQRGSLGDQFASAAELSAAGDASRALRQAREVGVRALAQGRFEIAAKAGTLALDLSKDVGDRLEAGLLAARSELARGRPREAESIARRIMDTALSPDDALRVQLCLARACVQTQDPESLYASVSSALSFLESAADPRLRSLGRLQIAHAKFEGAYSDRDKLATGAVELEEALWRSRALVDEDAGVWLEALKSFLRYKISVESRVAAAAALRKFAPTVTRMPEPGPSLTQVWTAYFEYRRVGPRGAHDMLKRVKERRSPSADQIQAAVLNNEAVMHMEMGDHRTASSLFAHSRALDAELGLSGRDQLATCLNQAQCAFFTGRARDAAMLTDGFIKVALDNRLPSLAAQGYSLRGLLALAGKNWREANSILDRLANLETGVWYEDDRYLTLWYRAACTQILQRKDSRDELLSQADRVASLDDLSANKMRVLAGSLAAAEPPAAKEARAFLRHAGAAWFPRFADRWCATLHGVR